MHGHLSFELTCPPSPKPSFAPSLLLTPLESALIQVFILGNLKLFRMNTYKKTRGVGVLLLTTHPMRMRILSERSESKDLSSHPTKDVCPERPSEARDLSWNPMRTPVLRSIATTDLSRPGREGSDLVGKDLSSLPSGAQL